MIVMFMQNNVRRMIALLLCLMLNGCFLIGWGPDNADTLQHGRETQIRHVFHIPPIVCWTRDYALTNPDNPLEHPDPLVTFLPSLVVTNPDTGASMQLPGGRPGLFLTTGEQIAAVCWDKIDQALNPSATSDCREADPPNCRDSCFLPWRAQLDVDGNLQQACRPQKLTIRDREFGISSDFIGSPVGGADSNIFRKGISEYINSKLLSITQGYARNVYTELVGEPDDGDSETPAPPRGPFGNIILTLLLLMLLVFFISMTLGLQRVTPYVALSTAIKFFLVSLFALDWNVFNEFFIQVVEETVNGLSQAMISAFSDGLAADDFAQSSLNVFGLIDGLLTIWVSAAFWKFILALVLTPGGGIIYALAFLLMGGFFIAVTFQALYFYFIALIVRFLLYALAPMFIVLALFRDTKPFFDGWLQQVLSFAFQPVFVFAFLGMTLLIMRGFLDSSGFTEPSGRFAGTADDNVGGILNADTAQLNICWREILSFSEGGRIPDLYGWKICNEEGAVIDFAQGGDYPFNVWYIVTILFILGFTRSMILWAVDTASRLTQSASSATQVQGFGFDSVKGIVGQGASGLVGGLAGGVKGATIGRATGSGLAGHVRRKGGVTQGVGGVVGGGARGAASGFSRASKRQSSRTRESVLRDRL